MRNRVSICAPDEGGYQGATSENLKGGDLHI